MIEVKSRERIKRVCTRHAPIIDIHLMYLFSDVLKVEEHPFTFQRLNKVILFRPNPF